MQFSRSVRPSPNCTHFDKATFGRLEFLLMHSCMPAVQLLFAGKECVAVQPSVEEETTTSKQLIMCMVAVTLAISETRRLATTGRLMWMRCCASRYLFLALWHVRHLHDPPSAYNWWWWIRNESRYYVLKATTRMCQFVAFITQGNEQKYMDNAMVYNWTFPQWIYGVMVVVTAYIHEKCM